MPSTTSHHRRSSGSSSSSKTPRKSKRRSSESEERTGLHPQWSGSLSFGLVSIPVQLYSATRNARVSLRMLAPDGSPVVRRFYCPEHEEQVDKDDLTRGYEYKPGKYVEVSDEELEALEPDKSRDIDLRLFVPAEAIDPVHFERMYFLMPSGDTSKAYHLLVSVMERTKRAGIATFVMHDREYLVAIFSQHGLLCAEVLRFTTELRDETELGLSKSKPDPKLVKQFEALLGKHAHDKFDPDSIHSQRNEAIRELATKKARKGKDVVETNIDLTDSEEAGETETVDLMKLLKQSLTK
ncbi:MAG TPA: Ku protein [Polyangiales bacterium]|nr:Ku protein [Polyangiales bacterium]